MVITSIQRMYGSPIPVAVSDMNGSGFRIPEVSPFRKGVHDIPGTESY